MRKLLLITSVVALVLYTGAALQAGTPSTAVAPSSLGALALLQDGLTAAGASLEQVQISGWVSVKDARAAEAVRAHLGWTAATPPGEERTVKAFRRNNLDYVSLRWVLTGDAAAGWVHKQELAWQALVSAGEQPVFSVQVGGSTVNRDVGAMVNRAMNTLGASERRRWGDANAASMEGRSAQLPPSRFGVNVQTAARRGLTAAGRTMVWVGWPALQQEY